jgi:hypothetical protein
LFQRPKTVEDDFIERDGTTRQAFNLSRDDFELAKQKMTDWGVSIHSTPADRSGSGFFLFESQGTPAASRPRRLPVGH